MLILTRKADEAVLIPAFGIVVRVLSISGSRVQLGFTADGPGTAIVREEIAGRYGYEINDGRVEVATDAGNGRAEDRTVAGVAPAAADGGGSADVGDAQVG